MFNPNMMRYLKLNCRSGGGLSGEDDKVEFNPNVMRHVKLNGRSGVSFAKGDRVIREVERVRGGTYLFYLLYLGNPIRKEL